MSHRLLQFLVELAIHPTRAAELSETWMEEFGLSAVERQALREKDSARLLQLLASHQTASDLPPVTQNSVVSLTVDNTRYLGPFPPTGAVPLTLGGDATLEKAGLPVPGTISSSGPVTFTPSPAEQGEDGDGE